MSTANELISANAATGIEGMDDILSGGLSRGHVFLLEKKRTGSHESTIREYRISDRGLRAGEPLEAFQGVLRGVPTYLGASNPLLKDEGQ